MFNRFILWIRELYMSVGVAQILRRRRRQGGIIAAAFDTVAFTPVTGAGLGGLTGTPIAWDAAPAHISDADFKSIVRYGGPVGSTGVLPPYQSEALAGTSPGIKGPNEKYGSGYYPDLAIWQTSVEYLGTPTYECTGVGANTTAGTPVPQMFLNFPAGVKSAWIWGRRRFAPGFTATGDADSTKWGSYYNAGGIVASLFTITTAVASTGSQTVVTATQYLSVNTGAIIVDPGGANQETLTIGNGTTAGTFAVVDSTHITANFTKTHAGGIGASVNFGNAQDNAFKIGPQGEDGFRIDTSNGTKYTQVAIPNLTVGISESDSGANITTEYSDGLWRDVIAHFEQVIGANSNVYVGVTFWQRIAGSGAPYVRMGYRRTKDTTSITKADIPDGSIWNKNCNQARKTALKYHIWGTGAYDDTAGGTDPAGVLAMEKALTPEACTLGAYTATTSTTATFPITLGRYGAFARPVVDGTEITAQEYAFPIEQPEVTQSPSIVPYILSRTVTGLATGSHTISFNIYNGNKTAHVNTGNQSVTIGASFPAGTTAVWESDTGTDVSTDGLGVGTWTDQINGYVLSQSTAPNKPILKTGILNGKPILRLAGSQALQLTTNPTLFGTSEYSLIIVCRETTAGGNQYVWNADSAGGGQYMGDFGQGWGIISETTGAYFRDATIGAVVVNQWEVLQARIKATDATSEWKRNATVIQTGTPGTTIVPKGTLFPVVGASNIGGTSGLNGDIAAIYCIDHKMTDPDLATLRALILTKYGV